MASEEVKAICSEVTHEGCTGEDGELHPNRSKGLPMTLYEKKRKRLEDKEFSQRTEGLTSDEATTLNVLKISSANIQGESPFHPADPEGRDLKDRHGADEPEMLDDLFVHPQFDQLSQFFYHHPIQPSKLHEFNVHLAFWREDGRRRHWLSYSEFKKALYCTVCLAFGKSAENDPFISGMKNWSNVKQHIEEHELGELHQQCVHSYMTSGTYRNNHLSRQKKLPCTKEIQNNRAILEPVIATVKAVSRLDIENHEIEHALFLDLLNLIGDSQPILKEYIENTTVSPSQESLDGQCTSVNFLSKTTMNDMTNAISKLMKRAISQEIQKAPLFSIQVNASENHSGFDHHCSVIVRYVTDTVHEKLLAVTNNSFIYLAKELFDFVQNVFKENGLAPTKCVGNFTDGSLCLQNQYNLLNTWLSKGSPGHIQTWCHSHVLDLILFEETLKPSETVYFCGLLDSCAAFMRDPYKRTAVWPQTPASGSIISSIDVAQWWSRSNVLVDIFGCFNDPDKAIFIDLLEGLWNAGSNARYSSELRFSAKIIAEPLCTFQTVLTAQLYLRILSYVTPLSQYLQTNGVDFLEAQRMISNTMKSLLVESRNFDTVHLAAVKFIEWANQGLEERNCEIDVETELQEVKNVCKKKESDKDEPAALPEDKYRMNVHNSVMDAVTETLDRRFRNHSFLALDISCLDPRNFNKSLPGNAFVNLCSLLKNVDEMITVQALTEELLSFASKWKQLKTILPDEYYVDGPRNEEILSLQWEEFVNEPSERTKKFRTCCDCAVCCYSVLERFTSYSTAYQYLYLAYKYILTLPCTPVACHGQFSKFEKVKIYLKNQTEHKNLEASSLMFLERNVLDWISNDDIIDLFAKDSRLEHLLLK